MSGLKEQQKTGAALNSGAVDVSGLIPPKRDKSYACKIGYDYGKNEANTTNCHFSIFSSKENTKE